MNERLAFTITRKDWLVGEPSSQSRLYRSADGKKCCLGFAALASGYSVQEIRDRPSPYSVISHHPGLPLKKGIFPRLVDWNGSLPITGDLMDVNDETIYSEGMTIVERECRISWLFASIDVDVEFKD